MRFFQRRAPISGSNFVRWSQKPLSSRTASTTRPTCSRLGAASTNREHTFTALDLIEKYTGVRSRGWTSPSVYPNGDTFRATAAEGIAYSLDGMDSDILSRLTTQSGPLVLIPYPAVTVDMGQYLQRLKQPADMERLWIDYVTELAREAEAHPDREATVVAIGIHPFVVGTSDGAAALRRVLENFKNQKLVWVTDVEAVLGVAGEQR